MRTDNTAGTTGRGRNRGEVYKVGERKNDPKDAKALPEVANKKEIVKETKENVVDIANRPG